MFEIHRQGAVQIVSGAQPITADNLRQLRDICESASASARPNLVLDLRGVPLVDSAGLDLILDLRDACLRKGGSLQLAGPKPLCRDILAVTGVADQVSIYETVTAAVGSFAQ